MVVILLFMNGVAVTGGEWVGRQNKETKFKFSRPHTDTDSTVMNLLREDPTLRDRREAEEIHVRKKPVALNMRSKAKIRLLVYSIAGLLVHFLVQ